MQIEMIFTSELLKGWTKIHDCLPWPEKRNCIEMYSAFRNQQSNGGETEIKGPNVLVIL